MSYDGGGGGGGKGGEGGEALAFHPNSDKTLSFVYCTRALLPTLPQNFVLNCLIVFEFSCRQIDTHYTKPIACR